MTKISAFGAKDSIKPNNFMLTNPSIFICTDSLHLFGIHSVLFYFNDYTNLLYMHRLWKSGSLFHADQISIASYKGYL